MADEKKGAVKKTVVVGVGGGGVGAVSRIIKKESQVRFVAIDTDLDDVGLKIPSGSKKVEVIIIGEEKLGAGTDPEQGRKAADLSKAEIKKNLDGTHLVILTAGMGGGTGTGAAPVVAQIARGIYQSEGAKKEDEAAAENAGDKSATPAEGGEKSPQTMVVSIITKPFRFEGSNRLLSAISGLEKLEAASTATIVVDNQKIIEDADDGLTLDQAYETVDKILSGAIEAVSVITDPAGAINHVDFADFRAVILAGGGRAIMGVGESKSEGKDGRSDLVMKATEAAIDSPLLETPLDGAKAVLICFISHRKNLLLKEVELSMDMVSAQVKDDAKIIWGSIHNEEMVESARVIIVATGVGDVSSASISGIGPGKVVQMRGKEKGVDSSKPSRTLAPSPDLLKFPDDLEILGLFKGRF